MFGQCSLHVGIVLHFRMCQHLIADQSFITQWSMRNSGSTSQLRKRQVCNTICAFCVGMPRLTENMKKHNFEQSRNIMNYLFMELHFTSCGIHVLHIVFTTSMGSTSHLNKTIVPGVGPVVRYTLEETRESDLRNTFSGYRPMFKKVTDPDLHSEWRVSSANSWIRQVLLSIPRIHAHAHPRPNDIIVHVNNLHVCTCYMSLRLDVVFGEVEFYQPLAVKWVPCSTSTWILGSYFFDDNFSSRMYTKEVQNICNHNVPVPSLRSNLSFVLRSKRHCRDGTSTCQCGRWRHWWIPDGMMIILSCGRFMIGTITVLASKKWIDEWAHELILYN